VFFQYIRPDLITELGWQAQKRGLLLVTFGAAIFQCVLVYYLKAVHLHRIIGGERDSSGESKPGIRHSIRVRLVYLGRQRVRYVRV